MNYIGSKLSLLPFLDESISKVVKNLPNDATFCDLFSGTASVGKYFKKKGYHIIANDLQYYSYVLSRQYIGNHTELKFNGLKNIWQNYSQDLFTDRTALICAYLDNLQGIEGFVYNNFCKGNHKENEDYRLYFSDENGKKCDVIRTQIETWFVEKKNQ